jgi:hypothetical protein
MDEDEFKGIEMVRLKAPNGTDEANLGEHRFKVHDDNTIEVPKALAHYFKEGAAGFTDMEQAPPPLSGDTFFVKGGFGQRSCSWRGQEYDAVEDGSIEVPIEAFNDLVSHGFKIAES